MSTSEVPGERRGRTPSKPGAEVVQTRAEAAILSSWQETAPAPASRGAPCRCGHHISLPGLLHLPRTQQGGLRGMGGAEYPDGSEPSRVLALPGSAGHLQDPVPTKAGIGRPVPVKCTVSSGYKSSCCKTRWNVSFKNEALGPRWVGGGKGKSRQHCRVPHALPTSLSPQMHQPTARGAPAARSPGPGPPAIPRKGAAPRPRSVSPRPLQPCRPSSCPVWLCLRRPRPLHLHHPRHHSRSKLPPRPPALCPLHRLCPCSQARTPPWTSCGRSRRRPTPSGSWPAPCGRD